MILIRQYNVYELDNLKVLNHLLDGDGFKHGISASQYPKVTKVSKATTTRHLSDLLEKTCIIKLEGGRQNTRYQINSELQNNKLGSTFIFYGTLCGTKQLPHKLLN